MKPYDYHIDGTTPQNKEIFVFGSNLAGVHGAGAAREALKYGAVMGRGIGPEGQSYAIPTKDMQIESLDLKTIEEYVLDFIECASINSHKKFFVTRIGCGLAGYRDEQIAPMFRGAPLNCNFPETWRQFL